jgi:signal transduction histidine kinase
MAAVIARTTAVIRSLVLAYIVAQVLIWSPFYAVRPARLAGPAVAVACCAAAATYLRRRRPGWPLIVTDSAIHVALALGAEWCVPPAMRGDTSNWLYIAVASQILLPVWFAPADLAAALVLASAASYWAAAADLAGRAGAAGRSPAAGAAVLLAIAAVAWVGLRLMARRAAAADAALDLADREAGAEFVALTRSTERREHDRLLHDTVLNTLTALARGGDAAASEVRARCRHDVTLMQYALRGTGAADEEALGPCGGLVIGIEAVAAELAGRGLTVHVDVPGRRPAPVEGARPSSEEWPEVPVPVATALTHAVREALANVASHAGTGEAWVTLRLGAAAGLDPGGLEVTVRDEGAGFEPARTDPARLGVRRSIIERVADWGGTASVRSAPGRGTAVQMRWGAPAVTDPGLAAAGQGRSLDESLDAAW